MRTDLAADPGPGDARIGSDPSRPAADIGALARGGSLGLVGAVVSAGVNLLLVLVVARGTDGRTAGVFFSLTSLFVLAETLCRLGADVGLVYFVARWEALGHRERVRPGFSVALAPAVWLAVALTGVSLVAAGPIGRVTGVGDGWTAEIRLLGLLLPVAVAYDLALAVSRGFGRMGPTALVEKIIRPALQVVFITAVLLLGATWLLTFAWVGPYLAAAGLAWLALRSLPWQPARPMRASRRREIRRTFWRFSGPRAVAGAAQIVLQRLDILLVAAMLGPEQAAVYTAATRILLVGQFINQALAGPVQPQLSALLARDDRAGAATVYRTSTGWLVLGSWPVFLLGAVFAPAYLALFGSGYGGAVSTVLVMSLVMLVATGCGLVDMVLLMAGRTSWNLGVTLAALGVDVVLDLILIPRLGVLGAAIGWAAAIAVANLVPLALVHGSLRLHPFGRATILAAGLCATCFGALPLLGTAAAGRWPGGVAGALAGGVLYLLVIRRFRSVLALSAAVLRRPMIPAGTPAGGAAA